MTITIWRHNPSRFLPISKLFMLLSTVVVRAAPLAEVISSQSTEEQRAPLSSEELIYKLAFSAFLVIIGGVMSGLTLGLMGLDLVNLRVLATSGSESEQKNATIVLQLLEKGRHWVLVVLLLSNVIVNESLPIFLDSILGGGIQAVILSSTLIVLFGEVLPQAVCARYGLSIGSYCAPFVLALMYLEFPVAYPIAKLLDWLLGTSHGVSYKKAELKTFVGLHRHIGVDTLNEDEVTIISAVLELSDKPLSLIMTPLENVYTLSSDTLLSRTVVEEILALGHSRIPIHAPNEPNNFVGMLIVKKLISYDPSQAQPISAFNLSVLPETSPESTCLDALNYFQQGRSHILLVSKTPGQDGGAIGVVSLEDVIEEMIGEEIVDETDVWLDVAKRVRVVRPPEQRVTAGKKLTPLIQGVLERRRTHYGSTSTTTTVAATAVAAAPVVSASIMDKVKVKGGGIVDRRAGFMNRQSSASGANTPFMSRSPTRSFVSGRDESPARSITGVIGIGKGERESLLTLGDEERGDRGHS